MASRKILFVCVQNSARSQMAEAWTNQLCGGELTAQSAGLEPGSLNELAVDVMREVGIEIGEKKTKSVFDVFKSGERFNYVVTVCDEASAERCPIFPGITERRHWSFPDPGAFVGPLDGRLAQTRAVRDMIRAKVEEMCAEICRVAG